MTDPPYGVSYDPAWRLEVHPDNVHREGRVPNDDRADWREAWALSPSDVLYAWHGGLHSGVVAAGIEAAGFEIRAQIVWVKPSLVMGRGAYHWQHEPCYYAVRRGSSAEWLGDRRQSTVWDIANVHSRNASPEDARTDHGTQKPVEAMARPLRNHEGDVYDPFLGSGTTLIAAETTGRTAYGIELDPAYAQVAIERWAAFTGGSAIRVEGAPVA